MIGRANMLRQSADMLFLLHQTSLSKTKTYNINPSGSGFIQLLSNISSFPNTFSLFNLPYNQINKSKNQTYIQIDYKEILALIHIFNLTNTTTSSTSSQSISQIYISTQETQLIYHLTNNATYQHQLTNHLFKILLH